MLTQRDPYVNMLRATMATFSAGLGGANSITVLPHTLALGLPDPFARRVARNTQLILLEESNLAKVSDPAAGSGGIETLTQQLCEAAWQLFQEIERAGGVFAALEQNLIQHKVAATRTAREANIARRKDALTGASEFPYLAEAGLPCWTQSRSRLRRKAKPSSDSTRFRRRALPHPSNACATGPTRFSKAKGRGQKFSSPISARPPISPRGRPLPGVFSRPAGSRLSPPRALAIRRRSPGRSRPRAQRSPVFVHPTGFMPNRRVAPRRPFKPPKQGISIWRDAQVRRNLPSGRPALTISYSSAAMRWASCRRPIGSRSKNDHGRETCSDRRLPMRRHSLCIVRAAEEGEHLPLPNVPEGLRRTLRVVRRHRKERLRLDPRHTRHVPLLFDCRA